MFWIMYWCCCCCFSFFFFKQKTAYEMRISDWSSDVCSSDLEIEFQLGKFLKISSGAQDLARGVYQFKFPGPQPVYGEVLQLLMARGDRLATTTEAITGQTNAVMQPSTVLALIDQSLPLFSTVIDRKGVG